MKTLWVVGGGVESLPALRVAQAMGLRVVVSDGDASCPGSVIADAFYQRDTYDSAGTAKQARSYHLFNHSIDGVIALAADVPVTVSAVAETLGLPGLPPWVAAFGADKLAQKAQLETLLHREDEAGAAMFFHVPWGAEVKSPGELRRLTGSGSSKSGMYIVKPVDSRGARGVTRLLDGVSYFSAYEEALSFSPSKRVMVEEWLDGPQLSVEMVCPGAEDGTVVSILDRNYSRLTQFAPMVIEDGAQTTRLSRDEQQPVKDAMIQAAHALVRGFPCTVKGDLVLTNRGPAVIELALRLSGGYMSSRAVPLESGYNLIEAAIKLALGEPIEMPVPPAKPRAVAMRYAFPEHCMNHPDRLGSVIATGLTVDEAESRAEAGIRDGLATPEGTVLDPWGRG